jgi:hypothetical protein
LGGDLVLCEQVPIILDGTYFEASYIWQDGFNESTFEVTQSGSYWVEVKNSYGINRDTIEIAFENSSELLGCFPRTDTNISMN